MKRKKINTNKFIGILFFSLLLTLGGCIFLKSDFFYLNQIVIEGNGNLTKEDIEGLLDIDKEKNIFFYDLKYLEDRIKSNNYVQECQVKREIPNKIIINIKEKLIIGPLYNGNSYCYIDNKGNFVEELDKIDADKTIIYVNFNIKNSNIEFINNDEKNKLILLCKSLNYNNLLTELRDIDFKNKELINITGKTGLTISLRKDENIEKNVQKLSKVLIDLQNRKEVYGKIDLTYNNYILYSPYNN